jgi:hypothetical protein
MVDLLLLAVSLEGVCPIEETAAEPSDEAP